MKSNKILVFDISGEFGHFGKYNTTTSPLTYIIPPRTSVQGILGAITGIDRFSYIETFDKEAAEIAIQLINPLKKMHMAFNLIDTKDSFFNIKTRTQIDFELLKDSHFRFFVSLKDEKLFSELEKNIRLNQPVFSPYLGLSQFTAKLEYRGIFGGDNCQAKEAVPIITAVNLKKCNKEKPIVYKYEYKYSNNIMPLNMEIDRKNNERKTNDFAEVIVETEGNPVTANVTEYIKIENIGNILFL